MAQKKALSGLDTAASVSGEDLIEVAVVDATSLTGYSGKKTNIQTILDMAGNADVEPNPEEEATEELTKLKINGTVYALVGGVYPNYEEEQF